MSKGRLWLDSSLLVALIWIRRKHLSAGITGKPDEYSSGKHSGMGDSHNKRAGSTYIEISEMRERERKANETRESADLDLK